jgi:hypothetical protein
LVDWGRKKIKIDNVSGHFMEVGRDYVEFIQALVTLAVAKDQHG